MVGSSQASGFVVYANSIASRSWVDIAMMA